MIKKIRKYFSSTQLVEKKSRSFVEFLLSNGQDSLATSQMLRYYQDCAPLFTAINIISTEFASIEPVLYDEKKENFIQNHPLLDSLYNPNADITGAEMREQIAAYFKLTGNAYIVATGPINRPPKELIVIPPQYVTLTPGKDGYTDTINVSINNTLTETFKRSEENGRFRYYSGDDREIWHIRRFNPLYDSYNLYGMSDISPIYYEIEQYMEASKHNLSLLQRGARPSGALTPSTPLSDDEFARLQEQMNCFYSGAQNAGRLMLLEGGMDFKEMGMSNRDMDFLELKKNITITIFNALKIPLPMVSPDHMSLANMETAKLNLYDNCVLPMTRRIYQELTNFLTPRYKGLENIVIQYSPEEITALEPRRNEELNKLKNLNVLTTNELRTRLGYEAISGGDTLYQPMSNIPLGVDIYTQDNLKEPNPGANKSSFSEFADIMRKQKNQDGSRRYNDSEILEIAQKNGL